MALCIGTNTLYRQQSFHATLLDVLTKDVLVGNNKKGLIVPKLDAIKFVILCVPEVLFVPWRAAH